MTTLTPLFATCSLPLAMFVDACGLRQQFRHALACQALDITEGKALKEQAQLRA
ncbi:hypothetical protein ACM0P6_02815 [Komagataeibacter sucrofermentans]|uniref:hypothetical protein n=1 Tax=Komagataeibacter sucrofermentans TaxID=1053551 RepID=UPI00339D80AB